MKEAFYRLHDMGADDRKLAVEEGGKANWVICPIDPKGHSRGGGLIVWPNLVLPTKLNDPLVWSWMSDLYVIEPIVELFQNEGLTGFTTRKVHARRKKDKAGHYSIELFQIVVTGWGGMADPASGIQQIYHCSGCHHRKYSGTTNYEAMFDPKQWDGSDFFIVWPLPAYIWVTQKVVDVLERHELKSYKLYKPNELQPADVFTPGRLSYCFPDDLAHKYGDPLGIY